MNWCQQCKETFDTEYPYGWYKITHSTSGCIFMICCDQCLIDFAEKMEEEE